MSAEEICKWQTLPQFPKRSIERIIRSVLPKRIRISDQFKNVVNRCVQIWMISVAATAGTHFKTTHLTEEEVIQIIDLMGFPEFVEPMKEYRKELIEKKSKKSKPKKSKKMDLKAENSGENCGQQSSDLKCDSIDEEIDVKN